MSSESETTLISEQVTPMSYSTDSIDESAERGSYDTNKPRQGLVLEKLLLRKLLTALGHPPVEMVLWDGQTVKTSMAESVARIHYHDRATLLRIFINPEENFGDAYAAGTVSIEGNLLDCIEVVLSARYARSDRSVLQKYFKNLLPKPRNSVIRARRNIYHHYDISNDFYKLWLDEQMAYTCAYFPTESTSLEQAQIAKFDHVCRKLWLQPGEQVVEAGCGWGALALHMVREYGVKVHAYNISKEQLAYARERARQEGLEDRVTFIEGDYREITGQYDAFVSVGMLEHVGKNHFDELGETIDRVLKKEGRGLIHSIGRDKPRPMNNWIDKRIFPGAYPPSLQEMMSILEPWRLAVLDVENLRLHYAKTLEHWLRRYVNVENKVQDMFDDSFVRAWKLYLAGSAATFSAGELQLFQVLFSRNSNNRIPWHRGHLYHM